MLQFIVLGYVPGTSIQISFMTYLCGLALVLAVFMLTRWLSLRVLRAQLRKLAFRQLITR